MKYRYKKKEQIPLKLEVVYKYVDPIFQVLIRLDQGFQVYSSLDINEYFNL